MLITKISKTSGLSFRFFLSFLLHSDSGSLMRIYVDKCKAKLPALLHRITSDPVQLIQVRGR